MKNMLQKRSDGSRAVAHRSEDPFAALHREVDDLFNQFTDGFFRGFRTPALERAVTEGAARIPRVNFSEGEKEYELTAELPGLDEKDLQVELHEDVLTIKGEHKEENEEKQKNYHLVEHRYGSYQRSMIVPQDVDEDKVKAKFKNGILTLTLPKKPEAQTKKRTIQIDG